jgi:hypothetical protein
MNNPGIDFAIWERLRKKWTELQLAGHKLEIEFRLIADPESKESILAIDVIQKVDNEILVETVQRTAGDAYTILGIAGLSMEDILKKYKELMRQLYRQVRAQENAIVITMMPTSLTSGEVSGFVEKPNSDMKNSVVANYQHYYMLTALREKMVDVTKDGWKTVKAIYRSDALEFYFDY